MGRQLKHESTSIDRETGEIVTTNKTYSIKTDPENFYMTYIESLASFFKINNILDVKVLVKFCAIAEYNSGRVLVTSEVRKEIIEFLNIDKYRLSRSIKQLKEIGLITGDYGTYYLDPDVFWKGTNSMRRSLIKKKQLSITINFEE